MNWKIIRTFYKMFFLAIVAVIVIWIGSCLFLFSNRDVDLSMPQYLILGIDQHITVENEKVHLDKFVLDSLEKYDLWLQVMDEEGKVILEKNTTADIPKRYEPFDLVDVCLKSDQMAGYTVWGQALSTDTETNYGVLLGCDSEFVSKISYTNVGNGKDEIVKGIFVLVGAFVLVVLVASYIFMKKISTPMTDIINGIEHVSKGTYQKQYSHKGIFHDVFKKLDVLDSRLKENKRNRNEWIANVSHDIKTPLSTIRGYAEILSNAEYVFQRDEIASYGMEMLKAEDVIEGLVADLRLSEQLGEGKVVLKCEETNLSCLFKECMDDISSMIPTATEMRYEEEASVVVDCDRHLLKRALMNIMQNAFIHNEKPICLFIKVSPMEEGAQIVLQDNGCGMSKEDAAHIFERYYRGTNSSSTKGTGLGMAIAKEIITIHGGNIEVESKVEKGTKFVITI